MRRAGRSSLPLPFVIDWRPNPSSGSRARPACRERIRYKVVANSFSQLLRREKEEGWLLHQTRLEHEPVDGKFCKRLAHLFEFGRSAVHLKADEI